MITLRKDVDKQYAHWLIQDPQQAVASQKLDEFDLPISQTWYLDYIGQALVVKFANLEEKSLNYKTWNDIYPRIGTRVTIHIDCIGILFSDFEEVDTDCIQKLWGERQSPEGDEYINPRNTSMLSILFDLSNSEQSDYENSK